VSKIVAKIHQIKDVRRAKSQKAKRSRKPARYLLRLFTTGTTPKSTRALRNLRDICESSLKGRYYLEVIDIYQEPGRASESDIIAAPTLIKDQPLPMRRMIGDLSDRPKVLLNLAIEIGSK
jgi:circadian clock protein KaiB